MDERRASKVNWRAGEQSAIPVYPNGQEGRIRSRKGKRDCSSAALLQ
jgi:hypothetical protein